eukprot:Nk52_evm2s267 gene=Nk52_evmTU2s267
MRLVRCVWWLCVVFGAFVTLLQAYSGPEPEEGLLRVAREDEEEDQGRGLVQQLLDRLREDVSKGEEEEDLEGSIAGTMQDLSSVLLKGIGSMEAVMELFVGSNAENTSLSSSSPFSKLSRVLRLLSESAHPDLLASLMVVRTNGRYGQCRERVEKLEGWLVEEREEKKRLVMELREKEKLLGEVLRREKGAGWVLTEKEKEKREMAYPEYGRVIVELRHKAFKGALQKELVQIQLESCQAWSTYRPRGSDSAVDEDVLSEYSTCEDRISYGSRTVQTYAETKCMDILNESTKVCDEVLMQLGHESSVNSHQVPHFSTTQKCPPYQDMYTLCDSQRRQLVGQIKRQADACRDAVNHEQKKCVHQKSSLNTILPQYEKCIKSKKSFEAKLARYKSDLEDALKGICHSKQNCKCAERLTELSKQFDAAKKELDFWRNQAEFTARGKYSHFYSCNKMYNIFARSYDHTGPGKDTFISPPSMVDHIDRCLMKTMMNVGGGAFTVDNTLFYKPCSGEDNQSGCIENPNECRVFGSLTYDAETKIKLFSPMDCLKEVVQHQTLVLGDPVEKVSDGYRWDLAHPILGPQMPKIPLPECRALYSRYLLGDPQNSAMSTEIQVQQYYANVVWIHGCLLKATLIDESVTPSSKYESLPVFVPDHCPASEADDEYLPQCLMGSICSRMHKTDEYRKNKLGLAYTTLDSVTIANCLTALLEPTRTKATPTRERRVSSPSMNSAPFTSGQELQRRESTSAGSKDQLTSSSSFHSDHETLKNTGYILLESAERKTIVFEKYPTFLNSPVTTTQACANECKDRDSCIGFYFSKNYPDTTSTCTLEEFSKKTNVPMAIVDLPRDSGAIPTSCYDQRIHGPNTDQTGVVHGIVPHQKSYSACTFLAGFSNLKANTLKKVIKLTENSDGKVVVDAFECCALSIAATGGDHFVLVGKICYVMDQLSDALNKFVVSELKINERTSATDAADLVVGTSPERTILIAKEVVATEANTFDNGSQNFEVTETWIKLADAFSKMAMDYALDLAKVSEPRRKIIHYSRQTVPSRNGYEKADNSNFNPVTCIPFAFRPHPVRSTRATTDGPIPTSTEFSVSYMWPYIQNFQDKMQILPIVIYVIPYRILLYSQVEGQTSPGFTITSNIPVRNSATEDHDVVHDFINNMNDVRANGISITGITKATGYRIAREDELTQTIEFTFQQVNKDTNKKVNLILVKGSPYVNIVLKGPVELSLNPCVTENDKGSAIHQGVERFGKISKHLIWCKYGALPDGTDLKFSWIVYSTASTIKPADDSGLQFKSTNDAETYIRIAEFFPADTNQEVAQDPPRTWDKFLNMRYTSPSMALLDKYVSFFPTSAKTTFEEDPDFKGFAWHSSIGYIFGDLKFMDPGSNNPTHSFLLYIMPHHELSFHHEGVTVSFADNTYTNGPFAIPHVSGMLRCVTITKQKSQAEAWLEVRLMSKDHVNFIRKNYPNGFVPLNVFPGRGTSAKVSGNPASTFVDDHSWTKLFISDFDESNSKLADVLSKEIGSRDATDLKALGKIVFRATRLLKLYVLYRSRSSHLENSDSTTSYYLRTLSSNLAMRLFKVFIHFWMGNHLSYDSEWGGIISSVSDESDLRRDGGSSMYQNTHVHYGYWIHSLAIFLECAINDNEAHAFQWLRLSPDGSFSNAFKNALEPKLEQLDFRQNETEDVKKFLSFFWARIISTMFSYAAFPLSQKLSLPDVFPKARHKDFYNFHSLSSGLFLETDPSGDRFLEPYSTLSPTDHNQANANIKLMLKGRMSSQSMAESINAYLGYARVADILGRASEDVVAAGTHDSNFDILAALNIKEATIFGSSDFKMIKQYGESLLVMEVHAARTYEHAGSDGISPAFEGYKGLQTFSKYSFFTGSRYSSSVENSFVDLSNPNAGRQFRSLINSYPMQNFHAAINTVFKVHPLHEWSVHIFSPYFFQSKDLQISLKNLLEFVKGNSRRNYGTLAQFYSLALRSIQLYRNFEGVGRRKYMTASLKVLLTEAQEVLKSGSLLEGREYIDAEQDSLTSAQSFITYGE